MGAPWQAHQSIGAHATSPPVESHDDCLFCWAKIQIKIYVESKAPDRFICLKITNASVRLANQIDGTPLLEPLVFCLHYFLCPSLKWGLKARHLFQSCKLNGTPRGARAFQRANKKAYEEINSEKQPLNLSHIGQLSCMCVPLCFSGAARTHTHKTRNRRRRRTSDKKEQSKKRRVLACGVRACGHHT